MGALAGDSDIEECRRRRPSAGAGDELADRQAGPVVHADRPQSQGKRSNNPSFSISRAPPTPSSAGWKMKLTVPLKLRVSARYFAAPSSIVVWPSWPQACIRPGFWLAYGNPVASRIGSASMSARSPTEAWPLPLRNTPTTPVLPTPRCTSMPHSSSFRATRSAVRYSSSPSSGMGVNIVANGDEFVLVAAGPIECGWVKRGLGHRRVLGLWVKPQAYHAAPGLSDLSGLRAGRLHLNRRPRQRISPPVGQLSSLTILSVRVPTPREAIPKAAFVQSSIISNTRRNEGLGGPGARPCSTIQIRKPIGASTDQRSRCRMLWKIISDETLQSPAALHQWIRRFCSEALRGPRSFSVLRSPCRPPHRCRMARRQ